MGMSRFFSSFHEEFTFTLLCPNVWKITKSNQLVTQMEYFECSKTIEKSKPQQFLFCPFLGP
jgi:hypothetical protein